MKFFLSFTLALASLFFLGTSSYAQAPLRPSVTRPADRIRTRIDDGKRVRLIGNRPALARNQFDVGRVAGESAMQRMILVLQSDAAQKNALEALIEAQHDPNSPQYQQWLTPAAFADQFGASRNDLDQTARWLETHGLVVEEIPAGRRSILFSGTAAQVESAFHTALHRYNVEGAPHQANSTDPEIPEAMSELVAGVVSLHDFRRAAMHQRVREVTPEFTSGFSHYLGPADFAKIYDVAPLYTSGIDGTNQSIAIVGRTNLNPSDVPSFRNIFSLAPNAPTIVLNGPDPGVVSTNELVEADLDVQWSGAVAPKASIQFVVSASTTSSDGVDLSAQYIVSHNLAPVMSTSFGSCEASMGSAERAFYNNLWQQAAAQGITTLISSGDSGAAGCDSASAAIATHGSAVNGLCSTPYSVCVGGTQFNEAGNNGLYWSFSNAPGSYLSALSYIPEVTWNESGANVGGSALWATGGGASSFFAKPSWQTGLGVPADGKRDVPDVSLAAAGHDGYLVVVNGGFYVVSGTSASSPSFAGLMALINQKTASRQGNANTKFYALASSATASAGFHDITGGNNSVPGITGFSAAPHYDLATGLGSVDAFILANHWLDSTQPVPNFTLSGSASTLSVVAGSSGTVNLTTQISNGFNAGVTFSINSVTGVTNTFAPGTILAPGAGTSVLTVAVGAGVAAGNYSFTISATGGGVTQTTALTLTVTAAPTFTLSAASNSLSVVVGASGTVNLTTQVFNGFSAGITFSINSVTGLTSTFAPTTILAPGAGTSVLTVAVGASVATGPYSLTISATGGGVTQTAALTLTVTPPPPPSFTLSAASNSLSVVAGTSGTVNLTTQIANGFNAGVAFSINSVTGLTSTFAPTTIQAPGAGTSVLTVAVGASVAAGPYSLTVTATGGGVTKTTALTLTVTPAPTFTLSPASNSLSVAAGSSGTANLTTQIANGFSAGIAFSINSITGLTSTFAPTTIQAPGAGTSVLTVAVGASVAAGPYSLTVTATGGGVTKTTALTLTVTPLSVGSFTLKVSPASTTLIRGQLAFLFLSTTATADFTSPLTLSVTGLPNGITATFSQPTITTPAAGQVYVYLNVSPTTTPGTQTVTFTATGGGQTQTANLQLTVR